MLESAHQHHRHDGHYPESRRRAAPYRIVAHCECGNDESRKSSAYAHRDLRDGHEFVSVMRIGRERGHHAPIGYVVHGERNREKEVHCGKQAYKRPALRRYVEQHEYIYRNVPK